MFSLPIPLLLVITDVTCTLMYVLRSVYSKNFPDNNRTLWFFNLVQNIFCGFMILAIFGGIGEISVFTLLLGAVFGCVSAFQLLTNLKAYSSGPISYTMVIVSLSAIIPTLSGLFFGETISLPQWIGIVLMAICIILSPNSNKGAHSKKSSAKWLFFCAVAALLSGAGGVIQKVHQISIHKEEQAALLLTNFVVATVISLAFYFAASDGSEHRYKLGKEDALRALLPILTGIFFAFPHTINLNLAGRLPSAVMFPLVNLPPMILSTVTAIILFKERLSLRRWIGLIIGVISTLFIGGVINF